MLLLPVPLIALREEIVVYIMISGERLERFNPIMGAKIGYKSDFHLLSFDKE
jgi:hypothetical protein